MGNEERVDAEKRAGEEELFLSMQTTTFAGNRPFYDRELYSPSRTWVALRGNEVVARAAWAAASGTDVAVGVDWFDLHSESDGAALLRAAHETMRDRYGRVPDYHIMLQPGWRDRPAERAGVELRLAAAERAGLRLAGERVRTVWTDPGALPAARDVLPASPEAVLALGFAPVVLTGVETAFVEGVDLRENPLYGLDSPRAFVAADGTGGAILGMGLHRDTPVIGYLCADGQVVNKTRHVRSMAGSDSTTSDRPLIGSTASMARASKSAP
jgi:hypothetical protein